MLAFYEKVLRLKRLPRTGWLFAGVPQPESVAEHAYGTAVVASMLAHEINAEIRDSSGDIIDLLDIGRVALIALVHDLSESSVTDLPKETSEVLGIKTKHDAEALAIEKLFASVVGGAEYQKLWHEYEQTASAEAKLVRDADKLEMVLQAREYELSGNQRLEEFWHGYHWHYNVSARLFQQLQDERNWRNQGSVT